MLVAAIVTLLGLAALGDAACVCVPFYQCDDDGKLNQFGSLASLDPRIPLDEEQVCFGETEICCELPEEEEETQDKQGVTSTASPETSSFILVPEVPKGLTGCGLKRINPLDQRIDTASLSREETFFGEYPWMVALYRQHGENKTYICGGSLISPGTVLTAAHCLINEQSHPGKIIVRAGDWDTKTDLEPIVHQERNVSKIITHEHFNRGNLINDIALIFAEEPFHLTESVDIICLPENSFTPINCQASGWGVKHYDEPGHFQAVMTRVKLPLVPNDECQEKLKKSRLGKYFKLHQSFICAGGIQHTDTCKGDGGSPLVCSAKGKSPHKFIQIGIVSWGIDCGSDLPGVYTSVTHFYNWISKHIALNDDKPTLDDNALSPAAGLTLQDNSALYISSDNPRNELSNVSRIDSTTEISSTTEPGQDNSSTTLESLNIKELFYPPPHILNFSISEDDDWK